MKISGERPFYGYYASPVGLIGAEGHGRTVSRLWIENVKKSGPPLPGWVRNSLISYFARRSGAAELALNLTGTPFQKAVWRAVQRIPYGHVWTYRRVAQITRYPKAVRAVANAVGANPVAIFVPCHRVVRTDGSIGGYAYGIRKKSWLLRHESRYNSDQGPIK